jgi:hypothetical protein
VCLSVSVDEPEDHAKALKFLKKLNATFANYLLDEKIKVWQDLFDTPGLPAVRVYDQSGKLVGRFEDYEDVEKLVVKLLESK